MGDRTFRITDGDLARYGAERDMFTFKIEVHETLRHRFRTWLALTLVRLAAWVFYGIGVETEDVDAISE